jgi:hypothetical protein
MVVLVALVLSNIGLTIYLIHKINKYIESADKQARLSVDSYNATLAKVITQIKNIPKEITIKNVLNIP